MKTYHIYVRCESIERFDVSATTEDEARAKFEDGEAHLVKDEVQSRDIERIEEAP